MPTWKIGEYRFYFRTGEPLEKYEPAHIHVLASKGKIQFWLPSCEIKKVEGNVSTYGKSKILKLVKENLEVFLKKWKELEKNK